MAVYTDNKSCVMFDGISIWWCNQLHTDVYAQCIAENVEAAAENLCLDTDDMTRRKMLSNTCFMGESTKLGLVLCGLMTPGLSKDIQCRV